MEVGQEKSSTDRSISVRLRAARKGAGLTQREMADAGGIGVGTQIRWEAGEGMPSTDYCFRIEQAGFDWIWILTGQPGNALSEQQAEWIWLCDQLDDAARSAVFEIVRRIVGTIERPETVHTKIVSYRANVD